MLIEVTGSLSPTKRETATTRPETQRLATLRGYIFQRDNDAGMSSKKIAEKYGMSISGVSGNLREHKRIMRMRLLIKRPKVVWLEK